ncbi:hypothetical protein EIP86_007994 [Pleurotus ostreatoroseus]|nr:hypothetical protein EIP86_007994 [Pleurotus ostreatoroseus]
MPPSAPRTLLTLNRDILTLIVELLSIEDARNFRLCSKRAAFFAAAHALSRWKLRLLPEHTVERVDDLLEQQADRLPLVRCLIVERWNRLKDLNTDIANALLRLLSKTPGVRELFLDEVEDLLGLAPDLLHAVACLPHLRKLTFPYSSAKVSAWFLRGGHIPLAKTLTHLTLSLLDVSDKLLGARPPPQFLSLRSLSIGILKGRITHLVTFAPLLHELTMTLAPAYEVPSGDKTGWTTLTAVTGHIETLYSLLPLFRSSIRTVAITGSLSSRADAQCIQPVLHALQPACLEFDCHMDYWLVCQHLTSEPQCFAYLGLCAPKEGCQWMSTLSAFGRKFTALRCLDIDMSGAETDHLRLANEVHYLSCKMPTLRFLLSHSKTGCPSHLFGYPRSALLRESCIEPVADTTRGIVFKAWKKAAQFSDWQHGRREANLSEAQAQRVRDAFREGAFDARLVPGGERIG